jgi:hypothetical protein
LRSRNGGRVAERLEDYRDTASAEDCYGIACLHARCYALVHAEKDFRRLPDSGMSEEEWYFRSVKAWLDRALTKGFKDFDRITNDPALDSVRSQAQIKSLLSRLNATH